VNATSLALTCSLLLVPASAPQVGPTQSKPIKEHPFFPDGGTPANTLGELVGRSVIVIQGVVEAERPADVVYPPRDGETFDPYLRTAYSVRVREVFKSDAGTPNRNDVIEFLQDGGRRDRGTFVDEYLDSGFPNPKIGEEYILFLAKFSSKFGGTHYGPATGPGSAFLVHDGQVTPRSKGPLSSSLVEKGLSGLQALLRGKNVPHLAGQ